MSRFDIEMAIQDCVQVNVSSSLIDEIAELTHEELQKKLKAEVEIRDGFIFFDGFKMAEFVKDADVPSVNKFKNMLGDYSALSHTKKER